MEGAGAIIAAIILNDLRDAEEQAQEPIRRFYQQEAAFELSEVKFIKLFATTLALFEK